MRSCGLICENIQWQDEAKMGVTKFTASVTVEDTSPWFSGHFPNDPILPGIAQLQMVADLIGRAGKGNGSFMSLSRVKFRKLVRPGERLDIEVQSITPNHYMFTITSGNHDVCSGKMFFTKSE